MKGKIKLPEGYELEKLENGDYEVVKKPFELELGKDYTHVDGDCLVIDREGDDWNSGFTNDGYYYSNIRCSSLRNWREATEEEVVKFFERHLIKRYGEDWKNVKVKECLQLKDKPRVNTEDFMVGIVKALKGWKVWNKNGCLFYEGKWAEVLEEKKVATNLSEIDRPYYIGAYGKLFDSGGAPQTKNHMTSKDLCEGVLALKQLIAFRDNFHEVHGGVYGNNHGSIRFDGDDFLVCNIIKKSVEVALFDFADYNQAKEFYETHKELFEELKKLY